MPQIAPIDQPPNGLLSSDGVPANQPPQNLRFERLGIEDGLPNSAVWKILQDSEGYMWLGTPDGLNRYDGHSFRVYHYVPEDPSSLRDEHITSIHEDRSGVLWIRTQQGWLEKYDREQDQFTHYRIGSWITAVYEDRSGVLWIGDREGLFRFDRVAEQATLITSERGWVEDIHEDRAGQLWFGTEDGWFSTLDRSSGEITDYAMEGSATPILEDPTGALWVGTYCGGLAHFDPQAGQLRYYRHDPDVSGSLAHDLVRSIYMDRLGTLCAGSRGGLDRYDRETDQFIHYDGSPVVM